ncbi:cupin [Panacagrimonas perspica]|nr:cupin [Panacagrimonas perspica]
MVAATRVATGLLLASTLLAASPAMADGKRETIAPAFANAIPNIPGKSIIAAVVTYPPGGTSPAHHHAKSAFVTAYVLSGAIRSQVDDGPAKVFKAGESWSEAPGARHTVSENASKTEPASLLAIFVVDTTDTELTTFDQHTH